MAMLTIMGMYDYDNTIFDSLTLPEGINKTTAVEEIVMECAELECLYPSVPFLKRAVGIWSATMQSSFNRVWTAINLEYDPIENYNRIEEESTSGTRQHSGQDVTSGSTNSQRSTADTREITDSGNVTNKIAGFDASALVDHDSGSSSRTGRDSASGTDNTIGTDRTELTHGEKIADAGTRQSHIHGNIGVTTSQQMLESELDLIPRLNFYRYLAEEFKRRFCILVY